jgi:hypothetical protein
MPRNIDDAKALNECLEQLRSGAGDQVAALHEIGGGLRATRGLGDEPHWLEALAREIGAARSPRKSPVFDEIPSPWASPVHDPATRAARGIVDAERSDQRIR